MAKHTGDDGRKAGRSPRKSAEAKKGFETTVDQLEQIVAKLESGELSLEESLAAFEQGVGLIKNAETILNDAERRVEILLKDPGTKNGTGLNLKVKPFSTPGDEND